MRVLVILVGALLASCLRGGEFKCASDADCDRGGAQGVCQDVGYCSFADGSCASGQRFADLSGGASNTCVGGGPPIDGPPDTTGQFTIGGAVSGLSGSLTLQKNGGDSLNQTADGAFTFAGTLIDGADYLITVGAQPASQTCIISNGTGQVAGANVTNVGVACGGISVADILCSTGTTCAVGTAFCCFDPLAGSGACTAGQCSAKRVECDSSDDCNGNLCCASYTNQDAFKGAQCQTSCAPTMGGKVELWCDPAQGAAACPVNKTCTGTPIVPNPGYKTCI